MRKIKRISWLICLLVILYGCKQSVNIDEARAQQYASYIKAIEDNELFMNAADAQNFNLSVVMNQVSEQEYRYDIVLDQPRVAMHEIQMIAIERDLLGTLREDKLMPSLGILEADTYHLLPNQTDVDKGYPEGLIISGTTDQPTVTLQVLIVWTGDNQLSQNRDFFTLQGTYTVENNDAE